MRIARHAGLTGALTIALLTFTACGGGTASPSAAASIGPTTPPASQAAESVAPTADASVPAVIPSFDLRDLVANLDGVDSYRVTIAVDGTTQYTGTVVTKPVLARDVTLDDGTRFVIIGDEAWTGTGDNLVQAPAALATGMLAAFDPTLLVGMFAQPGAMAGAVEEGTEEKNGVQAHHYRLDSTTIAGAMASLPPGAAIDLWIADAGYLVSMSMSGVASGGVAIDVTNVNDPANVVERPS